MHRVIQLWNSTIALRVSAAVGTMPCAYLFFVWALLPLIYPKAEPLVAYISQAVLQLVLLPVIMVGGAVASQRIEERAQQDHEAIMASHEEIKDTLVMLRELLHEEGDMQTALGRIEAKLRSTTT